MSGPVPFAQRNAWKLYANPAFSQRLQVLIETVEGFEKRRPNTYRAHPTAKLLKRTLDLILIEIPRDPNGPGFQLGNTLGPAYRHLFFRFSSDQKTMVYAWVNDEATLRKAGAHIDATVADVQNSFHRRYSCTRDHRAALLQRDSAASVELRGDLAISRGVVVPECGLLVACIWVREAVYNPNYWRVE